MAYSTHDKVNEQQQNKSSNQTATAKFVDNRASTTVQLAMQQFMHNSPRATVQHAVVNTMNTSPVQQQKVIQRAESEEELQMAAIPQTVQLADMDEEELLQGKFETTQRMEDEELLQGKFETAQRVQDEELLQGKFEPAQWVEKPNNTGLPNQLKAGIENLSGMSMDHVKVHYNSEKPAQLQAHAYAQGSEIHVAPGQEKHLPHEAWHVVQQAQGRVKPTAQMKGRVNVNDDVGLEGEADVMGARAAANPAQRKNVLDDKEMLQGKFAPVQRAGTKPNTASTDGQYRIKLSSAREEFTYGNEAALGLQGVLPGHHVVTSYLLNHEGKVRQVTATVGAVATVIDLATPIAAPAAGKRLLVIDTVGRDLPGAQPSRKLFMDIKIGTYTKSGEQFQLEGAGWFMRTLKKLEHNIKDSSVDRGNRTTGYDIDASNLADFDQAFDAAMVTPANSLARNELQAALQALTVPLASIQGAMLASPVSFVGSSLFIVLNLDNPAASEVKLIDPDHPIVDTRLVAGLAPPPDVMTDQRYIATPERSWDDYLNKWKNGFDTGIANFINNWFRVKKNAL